MFHEKYGKKTSFAHVTEDYVSHRELGAVIRTTNFAVGLVRRGPLRIISLMCLGGAAWTAASAARTEHGDDCPLSK